MQKIILKNFRIVDYNHDFFGSIIIENGIITKIINDNSVDLPEAVSTAERAYASEGSPPAIIINGGASAGTVMPAFIDLHAHFREPGFPEKETLESASLAAAAGGFSTVVCMANTNPVIDTAEKASALKTRSDALGLIDLYPVLSLTKNMEGKELSGIKDLSGNDSTAAKIIMLSEDGKDVLNDDVFLAAMGEARRLGIPVSCHCDLGKQEAVAENDATRRAIELGKKAGCHIHIAHVSTSVAAELIRNAKKIAASGTTDNGFSLTCEATPHHIGAAEEDARQMGDKSFGRVNPPLQSEADRRAIIAAIYDGTIDAIATDHAPHSNADKAAGSPGFTGLETAFAVCLTNLFLDEAHHEDLQHLSALMSKNPARILGLQDRGCITEGLRADLVIADTQAAWKVEPEQFKSRGKCTPFAGRNLQGKILMTLNAGKIVYQEPQGVLVLVRNSSRGTSYPSRTIQRDKQGDKIV